MLPWILQHLIKKKKSFGKENVCAVQIFDNVASDSSLSVKPLVSLNAGYEKGTLRRELRPVSRRAREANPPQASCKSKQMHQDASPPAITLVCYIQICFDCWTCIVLPSQNALLGKKTAVVLRSATKRVGGHAQRRTAAARVAGANGGGGGRNTRGKSQQQVEPNQWRPVFAEVLNLLY